jgi:ribosomal protein L37AE/L43A
MSSPAFDKAWSLVKMAVHSCPVCGSDKIRRMNPDDVDIHCDNCNSSWGVKYIDGSPTIVTTGPTSDRSRKEQEAIGAHREKWDPEYAEDMERRRRWRAEREAEEAARRDGPHE